VKWLNILTLALTKPFAATKKICSGFELSGFFAGLLAVVLAGCGSAIGYTLAYGQMVSFGGLFFKMLSEVLVVFLFFFLLAIMVHAVASVRGKNGFFPALLTGFLLASLPLFLLLPVSFITMSIEEFAGFPVLSLFIFVSSLLLIFGFIILRVCRVISLVYGLNKTFQGFILLAVAVFVGILVEVTALTTVFFTFLSFVLNIFIM
jgi:hypothetical protein